MSETREEAGALTFEQGADHGTCAHGEDSCDPGMQVHRHIDLFERISNKTTDAQKKNRRLKTS
jgi:hypothetical protein